MLDRLIDVELAESGFRDPVLRARSRDNLGRRFTPDLERCQGLMVPRDLNVCLATARTTVVVVHRCLGEEARRTAAEPGAGGSDDGSSRASET